MELDLFSPTVVTQQQSVKADGSIAIDLGGPVTGQLWLLDHITVQCTSLTIPYVTVYVASSIRQIGPDCVIDYTDAGNNDVAEYPQAQVIPENTHLILVWGGCSQTGAGRVTQPASGNPQEVPPQTTVAYARATIRQMIPRYGE